MRSIYTRNLVKGFWERKKIVLVCWIVIVLIFGCLGALRAYPEKFSSSVSAQITEYEQALQEYDDSIATTQENISMTQSQVENLETYTNESVFMQIDPTNVQVVSVQYMITVPNMNSETSNNQISYISNAWQSYVSNGSLNSELANELGNISAENLSELITCTTAGNIITITVKHSEMDQARDIMQKLRNNLSEYQEVIQSSLGNFEMTVIDSSEQTITDTELQDTQNSNLSNLRNYKTTLADLKNRVVTLQTQKSNYEEQYRPEGVSSSSPKKIIVEFGALGVIAGIIIPFVIWAIVYTMSSRLKSKEELLAAGLTVFATRNRKQEYSPDLSRVIMDLKLLVEQNHAERICIGTLGGSDSLKQVETEILSKLSESSIEAMCVSGGKETEDQLAEMVDTKNIVLLAETGKTTCTQIEEQIQLCNRFKIDIWGCIVIE